MLTRIMWGNQNISLALLANCLGLKALFVWRCLTKKCYGVKIIGLHSWDINSRNIQYNSEEKTRCITLPKNLVQMMSRPLPSKIEIYQ